MPRKKKGHFHTSKQTVENLNQKLESLSEFVFDIAPVAVQCGCTALSLASKTPLTVFSDDSIVILYYCQDCDTPLCLAGIFEQRQWVLHDMTSESLKIMMEAAQQASEVTIYTLLLSYKIRTTAHKN